MAAPQANSFGLAMGQIGAFLSGLSSRQKVLLATGGLLVLASLAVFVKLLAKPEMKPLYTGMNPADAQLLAAKLALKKIPYETSVDGTSISVPADQLDSSRLEIASEGRPRSGRMGFEIFDKPNWAASDFNEKVNYQRALEGELERTLQTMDGVEGVRVHLVLPPDSIFSGTEREAKASVVLSLRGSPLTRQSEAAIARLVAGAVDKLEPENVTVVDADNNKALQKEEAGGADGARPTEELLSERLVKTLEPVAGLGGVRASVRLEYDLSSREEQEESYDPETTVALAMQRSEERSSASAGGAAGTSSNLPRPDGAAGKQALADGQISRSESGSYVVSKVVRHSVFPAGRIKRLAAAIVVDDEVESKSEGGRLVQTRHRRSPEQLKQMEELARAAIGADISRGDLVTVQDLPFQQPPAEKFGQLPLLRRLSDGAREWSGVVRYLAIALLFAVIYVTLLLPLRKQIVESFKTVRLKLAEASQAGVGRTARAARVEGAVAVPLPESTPEFQQIGTLKKQLGEKVKAEPLPASRLVQHWIREGSEQ